MIHYYRYLFVKKKVFNYSELHFSKGTSFKIHTLESSSFFRSRPEIGQKLDFGNLKIKFITFTSSSQFQPQILNSESTICFQKCFLFGFFYAQKKFSIEIKIDKKKDCLCKTKLCSSLKNSKNNLAKKFVDSEYRKVASSSLSLLLAHFQIFRRLMKGKFDVYLL